MHLPHLHDSRDTRIPSHPPTAVGSLHVRRLGMDAGVRPAFSSKCTMVPAGIPNKQTNRRLSEVFLQVEVSLVIVSKDHFKVVERNPNIRKKRIPQTQRYVPTQLYSNEEIHAFTPPEIRHCSTDCKSSDLVGSW